MSRQVHVLIRKLHVPIELAAICDSFILRNPQVVTSLQQPDLVTVELIKFEWFSGRA